MVKVPRIYQFFFLPSLDGKLIVDGGVDNYPINVRKLERYTLC
jgi:hypothetical protein